MAYHVVDLDEIKVGIIEDLSGLRSQDTEDNLETPKKSREEILDTILYNEELRRGVRDLVQMQINFEEYVENKKHEQEEILLYEKKKEKKAS